MKKVLLLIMTLSLMFTFATVTAFAEETATTETTTATETQPAEQEEEFVAEMNGKTYETLAGAVAEVSPDNTSHTITLLKDAVGAGINVNENQNIIFDFSGHTYTVNDTLVGSTGTVSQAMRFLKGSKAILRNGTLTSKCARMLINNYGDIILEDFTLDGKGLDATENNNYTCYTFSNCCGSAIIKGASNIYASEDEDIVEAIAFDVWYGNSSAYYEGVSVIFDKTFTGKVNGDIEYGARTDIDSWMDRTKLLIDGNGTFNSEFKVSANLDDIKKANITVLGGNFSSNVVSAFMKDAENLVEKNVATVSEEVTETTNYTVCYHKIKFDIKFDFPKINIKIWCGKCDKVFLTNHTHEYEDEEIKEATCNDDGYKIKACKCGAEVMEILPAAHVEETHEAKVPTCTEIGWDTYVTCSRCDYTTYKEIPATGHTEVTDKAVAATCTQTGLTKGKHCSVCNEVLVKQEVVPAKGHTAGEEATCTSAQTCTVCKAELVGALGHKWSSTGPECDRCKVVDDVSKVTKAYYNITEYIAGGKWSEDATVTFEVEFEHHKASVTFPVGIPSGLDMNNAGKYVADYTYKNVTPEIKPTFTIYPAKLTKVTASGQTTTTVTLKWNAATGANGYRVFYKVDGKWKTINYTTALSYKVRGLKAGTKYTFAVRPYYDNGTEKIYAKKYLTINSATCTATPKITAITSTEKGKVTFTFSQVSGETGYTIYRSTSKTSGFKKYSNYAANSKTGVATGLRSGTTYYFKLRTYKKTASGYVYSPWSEIKSIKVK